MQNKYFIYISNSIELLIIFLFLFFSMKYSIIANDDMLDFLVNDHIIYHGRIFTYFIQVLFIKWIPNFLGINIQNFSIISHGLIKSLSLILLFYTISCSFKIFSRKNIFFPLINIFVFFVFFALIFKLEFVFGIEVSEFFFGYIFPIPFFLMFWYKISDLYIKNENLSIKNVIILSLLIIFLVTSNEEYMVVTDLITLFYLFNKNVKTLRGRVFLVIITIITSILVFFKQGTVEIVNGYNLSLNFNISLKELYSFFYVFANRLFYSVLFLWIPIILSIFMLIFEKDNKQKNNCILKYIFVSLSSFLIFFCSLYFLGSTFAYENYAPYHQFPRYWVLHPGLLLCFYCFLMALNLFFISYFVFNKKRINSIVLISLFLLGSFIFISLHFDKLELSSKKRRETLYILDKLSVFYFNSGKTAVLPVENVETIIPTHTNDMPKDLEDKTGNAYKDKIYKNYKYLKYVSYEYGVNTDKGMTFKNNKEAMEEYKNNGGHFTDEELEKLDFSQIGK